MFVTSMAFKFMSSKPQKLAGKLSKHISSIPRYRSREFLEIVFIVGVLVPRCTREIF